MKRLIRRWLCAHTTTETVATQERHSVGGHVVISTSYETRCLNCGVVR